MMPTAEDFKNYIQSKINGGIDEWVDLTSGDVHHALGGYPSRNHRMAVCCNVMYQLMAGDDEVIQAPPCGKGATVIIRYYKHNHT